jgi:hypothetical protein
MISVNLGRILKSIMGIAGTPSDIVYINEVVKSNELDCNVPQTIRGEENQAEVTNR